MTATDLLSGTAFLPDWIPNPHREIFSDAIFRLSSAHKMDVDAIAEEVEAVIDLHGPDMGNAEYRRHQRIARPIDDIEARRHRLIAELALICHAASMDTLAGLTILTGAQTAKSAVHGETMEHGRKRGSYSPWKKWIEKHLKTVPGLKPAELWEMLKTRPPRGWRAVENERLGKYIEAPTGSADDVPYKRFQDAVSEVKRSRN